MSSASAPAAGGDAHGAHAHPSYVKIWAILLALLIVSFIGPFLGIRVVTLLTAFGIAVVKAYIVARYFMHINIEKKYVMYLVGSMLLLMFLMVGAVAPDVMHHDGANWHNQAAAAEVKRGMERGSLHGHGEGGHPQEHGKGEPGVKPEHAAPGRSDHAPPAPEGSAHEAAPVPAPAPAPAPPEGQTPEHH